MSGNLLDEYPSGATVYAFFASYNGSGASVALTGLALADILVYKNGSTTQRASTAGFVLLDTDGIDFDAIVGANGFSIDLADNTDAGFYAVGSQYSVWVVSVTIDGQTVNVFMGTFRIKAAEAVVGYDNVTLGNVAQGGAAMAVTALSIVVNNSAGNAVAFTSSGGNGHGLRVVGNGSGEGLSAQGGATGHGAELTGGATSAHGVLITGGTGGDALRLEGNGIGRGLAAFGGATGVGFRVDGGTTSGDGIQVNVTSGAEINADITGNLSGSVGSLGATAKADVNAEVVDALNVDTYAEPGQGTPAATLSLVGKINYLFKSWRNRSTQTATAYNLYNDDGTTVGQKATVSDDGTTFDKNEVVTGP